MASVARLALKASRGAPCVNGRDDRRGAWRSGYFRSDFGPS